MKAFPAKTALAALVLAIMLSLLAALFFDVTMVPFPWGQTSTPEIMREKLEVSQQLFGAIVLAELEPAEEHARQLHRLAGLQSWYVLPTPEYAEHSKKFQEAAQATAEAAKAGRADEAFEGYSALIRKCNDCHEYMRRVRAAQ